MKSNDAKKNQVSDQMIGISYSGPPPANTKTKDTKKNPVSNQKSMSYSDPPPEKNSTSHRTPTLSATTRSYSNT